MNLSDLVKSIPTRSPDKIAQNSLRISKNNANTQAMIRAEMLHAYGGKCNGQELGYRCFVDDHDVLELGHKFNDGNVDRADKVGFNGAGGTKAFYLKLRMEGWPKDRYILLCCNCNRKMEIEVRRERRLYLPTEDLVKQRLIRLRAINRRV